MSLIEMRIKQLRLAMCCGLAIALLAPALSQRSPEPSMTPETSKENSRVEVTLKEKGQLEVRVKEEGGVDVSAAKEGLDLASLTRRMTAFEMELVSCFDLTTSHLLMVGLPMFSGTFSPYVKVLDLDPILGGEVQHTPVGEPFEIKLTTGTLQGRWVETTPPHKRSVGLDPLQDHERYIRYPCWYDVCGSDDRSIWLAMKFRGLIAVWKTRAEHPAATSESPEKWSLAAVLTASDESSRAFLLDADEHLLVIEGGVVHRLSKADLKGDLASGWTIPEGFRARTSWSKEVFDTAAEQTARTNPEQIELREAVSRIVQVDATRRNVTVETTGGRQVDLDELMEP